MALVNPDFAGEVEGFGAATAADCFNCGTCAAICPLDYEDFPRRFVRYVQIGAREAILARADDLWKCLHCGQCTQACPRDAKPSEVIMGLRRFALDNWEKA